ncbi:bifunctional glutamate N-acetyltransferase/amino-acid acetyltransferase ArgJ [Anaerotalea alkaliphila]|uniref:Arginine biosynthesis bifunctional protein ArgJ n=1 Tax=Anaerotalea alkaliphila TaxID=2662126 RepID=A0A7X5KNN0_9FIRM|nr:bifunctional glutamate N-acetyltransferase/amino-acid acetyltransferase ArgJ [Anaerotalea alkaliphila]NDL66917.1 bifunctional glutamate N-acetyltransferase/amino-acid acetyltransferase ArgJ [Anaerotalea alkaliphila]
MELIKGSVTTPKGFKAYGEFVGIKRKRKDLAIVFSEAQASYAGVFTKNVVKAAPVLWNHKLLQEGGSVQAIVVNSGNANACTGEAGVLHTEQMARKTAEQFGLETDAVLVASTGVIGVPLPIDTVLSGIEKVAAKVEASDEGGLAAAEAIMTTDTYTKHAAVSFEAGGKTVTMGGMAKGSGMIHPNMATMLAFITTDLAIAPELLQKALSEDVEDTYNMISVDGDTSTNDMLLLLANGAAGNKPIQDEDADYWEFRKALHKLNSHLAKMIVNDGEGVTKFIEVVIQGAKTKKDAKLMGKSIITSNLVKTAFFGEDANWGRILCAMGYSGAHFDPSHVKLTYKSTGGTIVLMEEGMPVPFNEEEALELLHERNIQVLVELADGEETATAWGCDLSYEYVKINGEYRT